MLSPKAFSQWEAMAVLAKDMETPELEPEESDDAEAVAEALKEAEKMHLYDYVLINKDLDECVAELDRIVRGDTQDHRYRRSFKERFVKDMERIVKKRTGIGSHKD